jgi:ribosomal protein S18 acetylase RimI-like enzyme
MVIETVSLNSVDKFYECFQELMLEGYGHFSEALSRHFLAVDYPKRNFEFWIERNLRRIFLATEDGNVLGFLMGDNSYGGVGFVSWFGIRKPYRKQGIGSKLYEAYESYIKTKNAHMIELFTFEEVKPFYLKQGFKEIGRRPEGYYGQKNVIMDKKLGSWSDKNLEALKI